MAISRYDQRKGLEEAEANAIGTEYLRAGLMPDDAAANARNALKRYLDLRIRYYLTSDQGELAQVGAQRAKLEADLWAAARSLSEASPTPVTALVASGLNDVFNSTDATAAGWLDRIPIPAWWLLAIIGVAANVMLGFGARRFDPLLLVVVPLTVAISAFLIADIDSPRGGVVQVEPEKSDPIGEVPECALSSAFLPCLGGLRGRSPLPSSWRAPEARLEGCSEGSAGSAGAGASFEAPPGRLRMRGNWGVPVRNYEAWSVRRGSNHRPHPEERDRRRRVWEEDVPEGSAGSARAGPSFEALSGRLRMRGTWEFQFGTE